jgi:hypothetical protein
MKNKIPENFDWKFYIEYYEDLRNAGLKTKEDAEVHYLNHGQYENRMYFDYGNYEITIDEFFVYDEGIDVTLSGHIDLKEGLGKIMNAFKKLISKNLKYTDQKHIKTIINILKNPSSDKFKTLETLLLRTYPEFSEAYNPLFLKEMNTNPKYNKQFYKQIGNIITELLELL